MRLIFFAIALLPGLVGAQVWEKLIAPGLTYRMELDLSTPRMIHALRFNLKSEVKARAELGLGTVYSEDATKGRETISNMAKRTSALAAINADFFPFTGDPLGLMVRDGELLSLPMKGRGAFAWGTDFAMGLAEFKAYLEVEGQPPIAIDGVNQECGKNEICVNAEAACLAVCRHENRIYAVVKVGDQRIAPNSKIEGEVAFLLDGTETVPIQSGNILIAAQGTKTDIIKALQPGQKVTFFLNTTGFDWSKVQDAIGGGPFLVRNGKASIDWDAQGFGDAFANKRHPRTAVGKSVDGDLWFVAVDGRQKMSDGATLSEMAAIMLRLGCVSALNLDGGGSTALNILGLTVNRPSDASERPVANGIIWTGAAPLLEERILSLRAPPKLYLGDELTLTVVDEKGVPLANGEVIWSAKGRGWIDQGGRIRVTETGTVSVTAYCRGQLLTSEVIVEAKSRSRGRKVALLLTAATAATAATSLLARIQSF